MASLSISINTASGPQLPQSYSALAKISCNASRSLVYCILDLHCTWMLLSPGWQDMCWYSKRAAVSCWLSLMLQALANTRSCAVELLLTNSYTASPKSLKLSALSTGLSFEGIPEMQMFALIFFFWLPATVLGFNLVSIAFNVEFLTPVYKLWALAFVPDFKSFVPANPYMHGLFLTINLTSSTFW